MITPRKIFISLLMFSLTMVFNTQAQSLETITGMSWSPDGNRLAVAVSPQGCGVENAEYVVTVYSADFTVLAQLTGHTCTINSLLWSSDGNRLIGGGLAQIPILWDAQSWQRIAPKDTSSTIGDDMLSWNPDGTLFIGSSRISGQLYIFDGFTRERLLENGNPVQVDNWVRAADWGSNNIIAIGHRNGQITLLDGTSRQPLNRITAYSESVVDIKWNSNGSRLASLASLAGGNEVIIWDAQGNLIRSFGASTERIFQIAWKPNSAQITLHKFDGILEIWDTDSGEHLTTIPELVNDFAWSPDGLFIAYAEWDSLLPTIIPDPLLENMTPTPNY